MIGRTALWAALAMAVYAQIRPAPTPKPSGNTQGNTEGTIPNHSVEPVVIRDGSSVEIDIYDWKIARDHRVAGTDNLSTGASQKNKAEFNVPTAATVPLRRASGTAHEMMPIDSYVADVEQLENGKFRFYASLVFTYHNFGWRVSPAGSPQHPLHLMSVSKPVGLSEPWTNHFRTTYEYSSGKNLPLRLGGVTIHGGGDRIRLGTGCSSFRIESDAHPPHGMPWENLPCRNIQLTTGRNYPSVVINGVTPVTAIDVSADALKFGK